MDVWVNGWIDGWVNGWLMDGWVGGWLGRWMDGGWVSGWMDGVWRDGKSVRKRTDAGAPLTVSRCWSLTADVRRSFLRFVAFYHFASVQSFSGVRVGAESVSTVSTGGWKTSQSTTLKDLFRRINKVHISIFPLWTPGVGARSNPRAPSAAGRP